jgi:hypothetical protein
MVQLFALSHLCVLTESDGKDQCRLTRLTLLLLKAHPVTYSPGFSGKRVS